jgi:hypothetical protein
MNIFNLSNEEFEEYLRKNIDEAESEELFNKLIGYRMISDNKMPKSDSAFKKIGYYRVRPTNESLIKYYKDDDNVINFDIKDKTVSKDGEYCETYYGITMEELRAIGACVRELGWL